VFRYYGAAVAYIKMIDIVGAIGAITSKIKHAIKLKNNLNLKLKT